MPRPSSSSVRDKYLTAEEVARLLQAAEPGRDRILLSLIAYLGLRVGEAVRLRLCDIDLARGFLRVPTLKQDGPKRDRKTGKVISPGRGRIRRGQLPNTYIEVPIPPGLCKLLECHLAHVSRDDERFLFAGGDDGGMHLSERRVQQIFSAARDRAGLSPAYTVHALRHAAGVRVYEETRDPWQVMALLRHRSLTSTRFYAKVTPRHHASLVEEWIKAIEGHMGQQ